MPQTPIITDDENQPETYVSRGIADSIAMPLLIFSGSLTALLIVSLVFVVPYFTSVRVAGETLSPKKAVQYEKTLSASLTAMEQERRALVLPTHDALYDQLKEQKRERIGIDDVRALLLSAAVAVDAGDAVQITSLSYSSTGEVEVTGSVQGVGLRSMTVLAAYTEELQSDPRISSLTRPQYTRLFTDQDEPYSPFTMTFTLTSAK